MSFSYNLNTYSHHQLKRWLTILYRNQLLEESINNHFLDKALFRHYPLNNHSGFLKLAAGIFFNSQHDFQFPAARRFDAGPRIRHGHGGDSGHHS
ncbi:MAG: hypothetical protein U5L09_07060 [Bacteroidales bacterium]|nr:hypothetical protein [Bacteroidales bacterium]